MYQPSLFARISALCIIFSIIVGAFLFHRNLIIRLEMQLAKIQIELAGIKKNSESLAGIVPLPPAQRKPLP